LDFIFLVGRAEWTDVSDLEFQDLAALVKVAMAIQ
jgi:hypothetical protein